MNERISLQTVTAQSHPDNSQLYFLPPCIIRVIIRPQNPKYVWVSALETIGFYRNTTRTHPLQARCVIVGHRLHQACPLRSASLLHHGARDTLRWFCLVRWARLFSGIVIAAISHSVSVTLSLQHRGLYFNYQYSGGASLSVAAFLVFSLGARLFSSCCDNPSPARRK